MFKRAQLALLLLSLSPAAFAQSDLAQVWEAALANNPQLAAAQAQSRADRQKRSEAKALRSPQVTLSAGASYLDREQKTTGARFSAPGFGVSEQVEFDTRLSGALGAGAALNVQQNLYSAERSARVRELDAQASLGEVALAAARQALMLQVTEAYFDVLAAQDAVVAIEATQRAAAQALGLAKARYEAGDIAITDANDAQARYDLIGAQLIGARNELELRRAYLEDITGMRVDGLARPHAGDPAAANEETLAQWQERAAQQNLDVRKAMLALDAARAGVERYRGAMSPEVDAFARVSAERMDGSGHGGDSSSEVAEGAVGVHVTVPLWTGGMRGARAEAARALEEKARAELDAHRRDAARRVREAWQGLASARAQLAALRTAARSAEERLASIKTGFEVGDRPVADVLDAQREVFAAQRDLALTRYRLMVEGVRLRAAAGELSDAEIVAVNRELE